jgi:hypothetical protein
MNIDDPMAPGDRAVMRKPHPCGSAEWELYRIGADIGLRCIGCGRRVLLPRAQFVRQVKRLVHRAPSAQAHSPESDR